MCKYTRINCLAPFSNLISELNDSSVSGVPPVTCIVADAIMTFTMEAAQQFNIPELLFWTASACGLIAYMQYHQLVEKGYTPLQAEIAAIPIAQAVIINTFDALEQDALEAVSASQPNIYTIEELVRELMDGDKGKKFKKNAVEWKNKAEAAISSSGSSTKNLDKLVDEVLPPK
ncbi:hypothetical protein AG4045_001784 [Apium graveolens]|uniref:Uncharacterized protein n=1 Tax=Apium graveolens TaxID=4045 RepID=A0A6L5BCY3_APIGR|nr:hypothetical protein AG4045_001784 [Apium graveolens]